MQYDDYCFNLERVIKIGAIFTEIDEAFTCENCDQKVEPLRLFL